MTTDINYFSALPTEILLDIFTYLPAKDLVKCRLVCIRLKQIIDGLSRSDALWKRHCRNDYASVYKMARTKSKPGLLWYNIYRSLSLWTKLEQAREDLDEFASASNVSEEITNFKILRDGIIGVHKRSAIVYYNIETLERAKRGNISGEYLRYAEDDDTIVVLSYHLQLFIIRKRIQNPCFETNVSFGSVKTFLLVSGVVYYTTLNDNLYICKLEDLSSELIKHSDDGIMSLGYSFNKLHVLTFRRKIYMVVGKELVFTCLLGPETNLLHMLYKYNFLETLDWRVYYQWMYVLNHTIPGGPMTNIITVRIYGDMVFVGSNCGVFRIYYAPFSNGEFDLYHAEPMKQYNFMERDDCPVLCLCPIIQIDISEIDEGHMVIVAMPKKIAVLKFTHNFKMSASVAVLPYRDAQNTKTLRIEDCI